jgi:hypothetical protein
MELRLEMIIINTYKMNQNNIRQSPVVMNVNSRPREVIIKREESFVKNYPTLHTFFESAEYQQIVLANKKLSEGKR